MNKYEPRGDKTPKFQFVGCSGVARGAIAPGRRRSRGAVRSLNKKMYTQITLNCLTDLIRNIEYNIVLVLLLLLLLHDTAISSKLQTTIELLYSIKPNF
jgi:hypothetical protein